MYHNNNKYWNYISRNRFQLAEDIAKKRNIDIFDALEIVDKNIKNHNKRVRKLHKLIEDKLEFERRRKNPWLPTLQEQLSRKNKGKSKYDEISSDSEFEDSEAERNVENLEEQDLNDLMEGIDTSQIEPPKDAPSTSTAPTRIRYNRKNKYFHVSDLPFINYKHFKYHDPKAPDITDTHDIRPRLVPYVDTINHKWHWQPIHNENKRQQNIYNYNYQRGYPTHFIVNTLGINDIYSKPTRCAFDIYKHEGFNKEFRNTYVLYYDTKKNALGIKFVKYNASTFHTKKPRFKPPEFSKRTVYYLYKWRPMSLFFAKELKVDLFNDKNQLITTLIYNTKDMLRTKNKYVTIPMKLKY